MNGTSDSRKDWFAVGDYKKDVYKRQTLYTSACIVAFYACFVYLYLWTKCCLLYTSDEGGMYLADDDGKRIYANSCNYEQKDIKVKDGTLTYSLSLIHIF